MASEAPPARVRDFTVHETAGDRRRQEILRALAEVVVEQGVANLSVRDLAAKVGLTAPTLIHHFGPRDDLLLAIYTYLAQEEHARAERISNRAGSVAGALRAMWREHTKPSELPRLRATFEIVGHWMKDPERYQPLAAAHDQSWRDRLRDLIVAEGLPRELAERLSTLINAVYRGLLIDYLCRQNKPLVDDAVEAVVVWYESQLEKP